MNSLQKVTRVKLKINQDFEFILVGLVSAEPDYKLSLAINKKFRISLKQISSIKLSDKDGNDLPYSRFSDSKHSPDIIYNLVSNRYGKQFLIKELKNVDYLFQIHESDNEPNINTITASLREIETITAVFIINVNTIKNKNIQYLIP